MLNSMGPIFLLASMLFAGALSKYDDDDHAAYGGKPDKKCPGGEKPACPSDWKRFGLNCYKLKSDAKAGWAWKDAQIECLAEGGQLASVHSEEENKFIGDQIKKASPNIFYWIGMHLRRVEKGKLTGAVWTDGTSNDYADPINGASKYPWAKGEPNNFEANGAAKENCVHFYGVNTGNAQMVPDTWNDAECEVSSQNWGARSQAGAVCKRAACTPCPCK